MRLLSLISLGLLLVPLMGTATAGNGVDDSLLRMDLRPMKGPLLYLAQESLENGYSVLSVWEEVNGRDGLQKSRSGAGYQNVKEPDRRVD